MDLWRTVFAGVGVDHFSDPEYCVGSRTGSSPDLGGVLRWTVMLMLPRCRRFPWFRRRLLRVIFIKFQLPEVPRGWRWFRLTLRRVGLTRCLLRSRRVLRRWPCLTLRWRDYCRRRGLVPRRVWRGNWSW